MIAMLHKFLLLVNLQHVLFITRSIGGGEGAEKYSYVDELGKKTLESEESCSNLVEQLRARLEEVCSLIVSCSPIRRAESCIIMCFWSDWYHALPFFCSILMMLVSCGDWLAL